MRLITSVLFILLLALVGCKVSPDALKEEKEKFQQITIDWIEAVNNGEADLIITNARIITGTGEVLEHGTVFIKENRILSVEKEVGSAEGSNIIDANGKTVLPGLIDN